MRKFLSRINPVAGVRDFANEFSRPTPHKWQILGVSIGVTFCLLMLFIPENKRADPRSPDITFITTFAPDRTDDEIIASNIANQERQDAIRAEEEERTELRKDLYRALGKATGIDTDAIEREIAEEQAAQASADAAGAGDQ